MPPNPVRIVHVLPGLHYGGMERLVNQLAQRLPGFGFQVHIAVIAGLGRFAEGIPGDVQLHQIPQMSKWSLLWPGEIASLYRKLQPQIVHSHAGIWYKASRAARMAGVPVVVHTEHGRRVPDTLGDRMIDNLASRNTDVVIAVSEALAEVLRRRVVHDPSRVRVIANGVPLAELPSVRGGGRPREMLGLPEDALVIGSVGRLEPVKNYRLALETFRLLPSGKRPLFLVLAGDGSERPALEHAAQELGIAERVRFLGWRDDIEEIHRLFDLFVMTSRSEGTSVSLLEAMAAGLCPVVTDVGGNRAVLGPELAELVIPSFDPEVLATVWRRCIADEAWRDAMGRRARRRVEDHFSLQHMLEQHVSLYHAQLAGIRSGS